MDLMIMVIIPCLSFTHYCVNLIHPSVFYKLLSGKNGANTYNLVHKHGFKVLLMDGGYENKLINLHKEMITEDNVVDLFMKYNVPKAADYISIDID